MSAMKVVLLVDGLDTAQLLDSLAALLPVQEAELVLAYVRGPAPRAALDMVRRGPGRHPLPPPRERELSAAEVERGERALSEAAELARSLASRVETVQLSGDAGHVICELAAHSRADVVAVRAGGRDQPPAGPRSLGPAARFITDHCPCPVLLLRQSR